MKSRRTATFLTVAAIAALPVLAGCGSGDDSDPDSGATASGQVSGDTGAMGATGATAGSQATGETGATGADAGAPRGADGASGSGGVQPPHGDEPLSADDSSKGAPDNSISNRPGGPDNEPGRKQK